MLIEYNLLRDIFLCAFVVVGVVGHVVHCWKGNYTW